LWKRFLTAIDPVGSIFIIVAGCGSLVLKSIKRSVINIDEAVKMASYDNRYNSICKLFEAISKTTDYAPEVYPPQ
jgi:hypothetical protein